MERKGVSTAAKAVEKQFRNQPVTFISIHDARHDTEHPIEKRIEAVRTENDWGWIAAVDSGRIFEDSVTTTDYGVKDFPCLMIVDREGKIAYVEPSEGQAAADEKIATAARAAKGTSNGRRSTEDDQCSPHGARRGGNGSPPGGKAKRDTPRHFEALGESWPVSDLLSDEQRDAGSMPRSKFAFSARQIELALAASR